VLYARDQEWWQAHREDVAGFAGLRVSAEIATCYNLRSMNIRPVQEYACEHPDVLTPLIPAADPFYARMIAEVMGNRHVRGVEFIFRPDTIGRMGLHSGPQALNLALMLGARRIVLVGFDFHTRGGAHWHGNHQGGLPNPTDDTLDAVRLLLDAAAPSAARAAAVIVNASPGSALRAYPKTTSDLAVDWLLQ
jgi:hypothetical protein